MAAYKPSLFSSVDMLDPVLFTPEVVWAQRIMRKSGWWKRSRLVRSVAARRQQWPDEQQMTASLQGKSLYKHWHPDALNEFVHFGTRPVADGMALSCDPQWEASIFGSYPRGLWRAVRTISTPVRIWAAEDSYFFIRKSAQKASKNTAINWFLFGQHHCFPMEEPQKTGQLLCEKLALSDSVKPLSNTIG
ncbi:hypothetical protein CHH28_13825 [Bacterioplanes sanyensis]|uniref:Alpha/beta hydrolase n=1 Tax=Bacterioplanes sanyensis TaxID=1249553 RepID=A0A222FKX4_9GAMM|nr:hypothetical protein [Bacterioplanes sanyensis]ASP39685.1 hypothetical protein CHH28_13825 [Bacterioplanes sanyensis]